MDSPLMKFFSGKNSREETGYLIGQDLAQTFDLKKRASQILKSCCGRVKKKKDHLA
jgi:hypothetical protein